MKKFLWAGLLCALLACPAPRGASAQKKRQQSGGGELCPNAHTQLDMNACADRRYRKADAELNRVYQQLVRASGGTDAKLKAAQLAWLKFRDAECDYEAGRYEGGSMKPMVYSFCLADVTGARTKQLKDVLKEMEEEK